MVSGRKYTLEHCNSTAAERLGFCDSIEYVDCKTKMHWRCFLGHKWDAIYDSILNCNNGIGSWCPYCNNSSIGETICRNYFEIGFNERFPRHSVDWLIGKGSGKLIFDGYNEDLKVAFEFDGSQHKRKNALFHRSRSLKDQISRDKYMKKMCKRRGVSLIVIDGDISIDSIAKYIYDECKNRGLGISNKILDLDYKKFNFFVRSLDEERRIIEERGGILVSDKYISAKSNLDIICSEGHNFCMSSDGLKHKHWCPVCNVVARAKSRIKYDINDLKDFALSEFGFCSSSEYINSRSKYSWICRCGFEWEASWENIKKNRGTRCPRCSGCLKKSIDSINKFIGNKGKCLSILYVNAFSKLIFSCKCGNIFHMSWNAVQSGSWCPVCRHKSRYETRCKRWGY